MYTIPEAQVADEIIEHIEKRIDDNLSTNPMVQPLMAKTGMTLDQIRSYLITKAVRDLIEMRLAK